MRTGLYVRVSMREQIEGYSLDAQEKACRQLAEDRDYQVVRVYRDEGLSGKTTERPGFQAMMRDAEAGVLDVVLVHKLDSSPDPWSTYYFLYRISMSDTYHLFRYRRTLTSRHRLEESH